MARRNEGGYIIAQTALLIIPLMIFAAFATDIGYWYVQGQKAQRAVDAASLAGVPLLPDVSAAMDEARAVLARNGYVDSTPGDNTDFLTGPTPQVEVSIPRAGALEVKIRREETSFLGRVVLDSIVVERFAIAEFVAPVYLGNPSSGLGTGTIPQSNLGVPSDNTWLALNAYCYDKENGDQFMAGFFDGPGYNGLHHRQCGSGAGNVQGWASPNPNFDPDAYTFVVEMQPGSPAIDLSLFEPGFNCDSATNTVVTGEFSNMYDSSTNGPRIYYRVYGPSVSQNHAAFMDSAVPFASGLFPRNACYNNAPNGDGWWPMATGLTVPSTEGGFYYVRLSTRNPALPDPDTTDSFWWELYANQFSFKATYNGSNFICIFSSADPTCPQVYGLDWLPLYRNLSGSEAEFFLTEIYESHAGSTFVVRFFDAAEGVDNIQFVDPSGTAQPFEWRYVDESVGQMSGSPYKETSFQNHSDTCSWGGSPGNPCLKTDNRPDWNDHMVEVAIEVPPSYTCGSNCWWTVRYVTGSSPTDRSNWAIEFYGDPVQLVE
jgi:hypothetical protein